MKKILCLVIIAAAIAAGCNTSTKQNSTVKMEEVKENVKIVIDKYYKSFVDKDIKSMLALLSDDGLFLGTDPNEYWNKKDLSELFPELFDLDITYSYNKQDILIAPDGNSAVVINQFMVPFYSDKIPFREMIYLINTDNGWLIYCVNNAIIPRNEDFERLNKALE